MTERARRPQSRIVHKGFLRAVVEGDTAESLAREQRIEIPKADIYGILTSTNYLFALSETMQQVLPVKSMGARFDVVFDEANGYKAKQVERRVGNSWTNDVPPVPGTTPLKPDSRPHVIHTEMVRKPEVMGESQENLPRFNTVIIPSARYLFELGKNAYSLGIYGRVSPESGNIDALLVTPPKRNVANIHRLHSALQSTTSMHEVQRMLFETYECDTALFTYMWNGFEHHASFHDLQHGIQHIRQPFIMVKPS